MKILLKFLIIPINYSISQRIIFCILNGFEISDFLKFAISKFVRRQNDKFKPKKRFETFGVNLRQSKRKFFNRSTLVHLKCEIFDERPSLKYLSRHSARIHRRFFSRFRHFSIRRQ